MLGQGKAQPGVNRMRGEVTVNGLSAQQGMAVRAGDKVVTGPNSEVVFAVERDAMLLRPNSTLEVLNNGLRVVSGAVLCVFQPKRRKEIRTPTATIGIRGTGVYVEAESGRTLVCTCYGETVLEPIDQPSARETVRTTHHEQPRYFFARGAPRMVTPAPMINHSDADLELLKKLLT